MTVDQVEENPDDEPLRLAALLNVPCVSPGCHDCNPEIPGPLCCVLDATISKDPRKISAVLEHIFTYTGIPKLYGTIYHGLSKGNCVGTIYKPPWTPDPILGSKCLRLCVDRELVNPSPGSNTLEVICSLIADPIDSEVMASVGCGLSIEGYGHASSRPMITYVNRYLRHGGTKRRNRAAGLAWDLAGFLVARVLDCSGRVACGALSAFPLDWALKFRVWTLGCQGSRRVAEIERTGSDTAAVNEDLLWGYFSGILDYNDYERDWGRSADNIAIAFPEVNWVLECCAWMSKGMTAFYRHVFLPTIWWTFTTPQHPLTSDPAVIDVVTRHLANNMNEEHGIAARSCGVAIFEFIAKRSGVQDVLVGDIISNLYTHDQCLTDHDPADPCPVLKTSNVLSSLIKKEDIWHEYDNVEDSASNLRSFQHKEHEMERPTAKRKSAPPSLVMRPTIASSSEPGAFSLSCKIIALKACSGRLEIAVSLVHRLEHRKARLSYCNPIANAHSFIPALHPNYCMEHFFDPDLSSGNTSRSSPSAVINAANPPNRPEIGHNPAEENIGPQKVIPATSICSIEAGLKGMAPSLMSVNSRHICRPPLDGRQAALFRYYNEFIPEHLLQLTPTDVFSSTLGDLAPCVPELAPTRVTAEPERWRGRCWLMSGNLTEFINILEHLPLSVGLKPLTALVHGFVDIMSANHVHNCSNEVLWSDIHAAIQCAIKVLDEDMLHTLVILLMANITDVPFSMMRNGECVCWTKELWWDSPLRIAKPDIYDKLAILTLPQPDLHEANRIALQLMGFQKGGVELPAWLC